MSDRKKPNDAMYLSGSTLPKIPASPVLEKWTREAIADGVVTNMGTLAHLAKENPEAAVRRIAQIHWETTKPDGPLSAAECGTMVHAFMEAWLLGQPTPECKPDEWEQVAPFVNNLAEWMADWKPEPVLVEAVVFNHYALVAGRMDAMVRFRNGPLADGKPKLIDLKCKMKAYTNRGYPQKPYGDTVAPQLTGYKWAEGLWTAPQEPRINTRKSRHYLLSAEERAQLVPLSDVTGCAAEEIDTHIIQVTPLSTRVFEIESGPEQLEFVKAIADVARLKEQAREWVSDPLYIGSET